VNGDKGAFWGSARDIAILAVAILSFAGLIYIYTYLHVLGIDFSGADVSPNDAMIAASKIFVSYWYAFGALAVFVLAFLWTSWRVGKAAAVPPAMARLAQIFMTLFCALSVCVLGYVAARRQVHDLRTRSINATRVEFNAGLNSKYPALLREANALRELRIVLDTKEKLYVLVQPTPLPEDPSELPQAYVFSIRKADIVSTETRVPNEAK